jgi:hypothetical protein
VNEQQQPQGRRDIEARIIAKAWKDEAYKQELLTNPKAVIEREFEIQLPEEVSIQIREENPTSLYFVLPILPDVPGYELNEAELEAIAGGKGWTAEIVKDSIKVTVASLLLTVSVKATA